ncbi:hypothetical protein AFM11_03330 [Mycolicibacterium wolinskyi]|uniref:DUF5709 domain-containing protein n=1 Tax=Mycolicibacterium wolinskyi TaxID=59750 RepID=A0A132PSP1_9MYCO|nr:DUF5709 domain-containing protein [Mycolicibacterium wolinskyi]KWX25330.1 hypothetical protein AFM11_03330 [Mycolicibacterium wolinskyi]
MSSPEAPEERAGAYDIDDDDQLTQEDTLIDRGVDDLLDEGYSPPDRWKEPRENETLDEQLSEEEPDPAMEQDNPDEQAGDDEVGDDRAGRLVAPDDGTGEDDEAELLGREVGIDGGAASAEEAAVHVIDEE